MTYAHCSSCRLTLFSPAAPEGDCPRCGAELTPAPRALFKLSGRSARPRRPRPAAPPVGAGR